MARATIAADVTTTAAMPWAIVGRDRMDAIFFFFCQAEDGIRDVDWRLEFRRVLFRSEALIQAPIDRGPGDVGLIVTGAVLNLPAVLIVAVVACICYIGIRQSAAINFAFVVLKIAVVLGFVLLGAGFVNPANWHPLVPANTGHFGHFGWSGVVAAAGIMFFAFIGFDTVSTCSQEARNPRRDVPLGIVSSLAICSVLYVATALVLTGMVPYSDLDVAAPVALAIDRHAELRWLGLPVKLGAIVAMISVMLVDR